MWGELPNWAKCGALFAISGHHLKFPDPFGDQRQGTSVEVLTGHEQFRALLEAGCGRFHLANAPTLQNRTYSLLSRGELRKLLLTLQRDLDHDFDKTEKILIASIKATLMAADLAGSALPTKTEDYLSWLEGKLGKTLTKRQVHRLVKNRLGTKEPLEFQSQAARTTGNTVLIEAGCGTGKTVAAYLWASKRAENGRLFFCYPTTCTASEGFAGYLRDPDFDALLVHGRAEVDYRLLENMPQPGHEESELRRSGLEALETWPCPAVVCTAHTVLGLLENVRRGLYAWPVLARSVFVFDEVHAFSDRLFSYLLRFLQTFRGSPVLLMTATLQPSRKRALQQCCEARGRFHVIKGPQVREKAKRYYVMRIDAQGAWQCTQSTLRDGGKVLWVCNTINRAMHTFGIASQLGLPVEPFHSRYRYRDRLARQRKVIDGFAPEKPAMLAVTTQVAEMSLDLSADLLVSETAPVPAMIQRLGRLNRFEEIPKQPAPALFITPENLLPYQEDLWQGAEEWLNMLCDRQPKAQSDVAKAFIDITSQNTSDIRPAPRCEWLDGLWSSLKDKRAVEEASYAIDVVRTEDLEQGSLVENAIPMPIPKGDAWKSWPRRGRHLITPSGVMTYDETRGATWNSL